MVAQYFGAGDREGVSKSVHTAMILGSRQGCFYNNWDASTSRSLQIMNTPADVMEDAKVYMQVYYLGMIPLLLYNMGTSALRAVGDSKRPVYFLIISAITNIVLDLLLVAVIPMGVAGAALATVISEVLAMVLVLLCLKRAEGSPWQLQWRELRISRMHLYQICRLGLPAGLQSVLYTVSNMVIQAGINSFGTATVADLDRLWKT